MNLHIEKMFKCESCVYKSNIKCNLKQHIKLIHEKIKDFKCTYNLCNYTCSANGSLNIHIKQVHMQIKDFKCTYNLCNYTCSSNNDMTRHIKYIHTKIKDVKCNYNLCDFKCSQTSHLKRHIKSVHERPQESKKMSHGEYKIYKILEKLDIDFKREFTFPNLKSDKGRSLRYDFGIKISDDNYLLLEFDGKQHFKKVKWSNTESEEQINERFEYLQRCDKQKDEYAKNNNHDLLRIRYDDADIENKILKFFDENYELK